MLHSSDSYSHKISSLHSKCMERTSRRNGNLPSPKWGLGSPLEVLSDSMKPAVVICSLRSGPTDGREARPPKEGLKSLNEIVTSRHADDEDGEGEDATVSMSC
mmetsp:Transcript_37374/g.50571  ORF Transcript_37374/g.50571 Transcript_37374/m.50571 type:complete len:103 (+) Transcript_37374:344-652(+)